MAKVVSKKIWVKVSHEELERLVRQTLEDAPAHFEVVEVQEPKFDGHRVESVTLGLTILDEPAEGAAE